MASGMHLHDPWKIEILTVGAPEGLWREPWFDLSLELAAWAVVEVCGSLLGFD